MIMLMMDHDDGDDDDDDDAASHQILVVAGCTFVAVSSACRWEVTPGGKSPLR